MRTSVQILRTHKKPDVGRTRNRSCLRQGGRWLPQEHHSLFIFSVFLCLCLPLPLMFKSPDLWSEFLKLSWTLRGSPVGCSLLLHDHSPHHPPPSSIHDQNTSHFLYHRLRGRLPLDPGVAFCSAVSGSVSCTGGKCLLFIPLRRILGAVVQCSGPGPDLPMILPIRNVELGTLETVCLTRDAAKLSTVTWGAGVNLKYEY